MTLVVVSGSNFDARIAVTNFVGANDASTIFVDTGFQRVGPYQGTVVAGSSLYTDGDVTGSLVAVGHYGGDEVLIYDVTYPATPTVKNTYSTGLGRGTGIGCISLYGNYLVAGELSGPTIVLIDINQPPSAPPVSTLTCPEFADGGITSIAISGDTGLLAAAAGPYAFDLLNYATPSAPTRQPYVGNILGPFACDFDGSNIAIGDGSGNLWLFWLSNGAFNENPFGPIGTGLQGVTSIAVMSGEVVQVAAGNIASPQVTLASFESGPGPPPTNSIFLGQGAGNAGGALRFYGLPILFASTSDGLGVTEYNVSVWPSASPFIVAGGANLNPGSVPTVAVAAFPAPPPLPLPLPWPWAWIQQILGWLRRLLGF